MTDNQLENARAARALTTRSAAIAIEQSRAEAALRESETRFATGTPWEDTFPLRGRDGSYRWFLSRALPI
jgi:GAF domain-containing protein